ncbi:MAG: hypothetical protein NTY46_07710 [Candidatus Sumerlaeota bacterium]|nr:hypothetical protein [Candidatus Sumerlaeota bacterium]
MHAEGIRVIHHVTFCYASRDFMEQHRDWTQRDARNPSEPLFFGDYGGVWLFCLNNPDFRGKFISTAAAFTHETGVDGWMIDETEFLPDWFSCGCVHCRAAFRGYARKGQPPPAPADHAARERITQLLGNFPEAAAWRASAPGDVSVNVMRRNDGSLAVHLLNTTGALRAFGPGRGTPLGTRPSIPRRRIRNIQVEMECPACPAGQPVIHHFWCAAAAPCPFEWNNAALRLFVPEIGDYAVIDVPAPGNSVSP